MPLTAYHFGAVAPWGMLANLIGIPLTGLLIMPAGMAVLVTGALPGPQVFDDAALAAMQFGIDALLAVTGWFAGLPASPWRVAPPAPVVLSCLYGGMAVALCLDISSSARKLALAAIAVLALAASLLSPPADGVYYARGKGGHLMLAGSTGQADTITAGDGAWRDPCHPILPTMPRACLHSLFTPMAAPPTAVLPECGFTTARPAEHSPSSRHDDRLTAGCRAGAAMVVATVRADYPCRDGTPIVSLSGLPTGNYTLRITRGGITARAASGQYFRISPVSRP